MNGVELYINNHLVDLSESTKILFTYAVKNLYNPTIVKNSFSKSVVLEGTKRNNQVFNNLYNLDVAYSLEVNTNFNSSKRNPFVLYNNGEIIESGYMKLDSIRNVDGFIQYSCTLYGGVGDFLYSLMYDGEGNKKTLASLDYLEGGENELDFTINANAVYDAWQKLNPAVSTGSSIWDVINFMPAYNGISDTIDSQKVLVNTNGFSGPIRVWDNNTNAWVEQNGFPQTIDTNYRLVNGYALVELQREMSEWEIRDLRSYMQRPVISMKSIVEACCNENNNGGYEVVLDEEFFNGDNPYYQNAWITLPLFNEMKGKSGITSTQVETTVRDNPILKYNEYTQYFLLNTNSIIPASTSEVSLDLDFSVHRIQNYADFYDCTATTMYTSSYIEGKVNGQRYYGGIAIQLVGLDSTGKIVAGSNMVWLTSYLSNASDYYLASDANITNQYGSVDTYIGNFSRVGQTEYYKWPETLTFKMDTSSTAISQLRILVTHKQRVDGRNISGGFGQNAMYASRSLTNENYKQNFIKFDYVGSRSFADTDLTISFGGESVNVYSNTPLSKKAMLTTEYSPADYLLSYTKLFNLFYEKDPYEKKIYIRTMRDFYDGKKIDLNELVDRSTEIKITPLSFDSNTYEMKYDSDGDTQSEQSYKAEFGEDFGSQRVITGYEFDADRKQIYDGKFKNGVTALESGQFYTNVQDSGGETPNFLNQTVTYKLFNATGDTAEVSITRPQNVVVCPINENSYDSASIIKSPFYDSFAKVQFQNGSEPTDGDNVLVFFNGFKSPYSFAQTVPTYTLSDDVQEMIDRNEKPCYLYSNSTVNVNGATICKLISNFPQFGRYITIDSINSIVYSMDFGKTKELFVPNLKYDGNNTIFENYWQNYLEDLYDIDTRIVECYVRFPEKVMLSNLKHYYYFDNCYWVLNEVSDYNPVSNEPVRCKFVKVNNFGVYTDYDPSELPKGVVVITLDSYVVPASGGTIGGYVWTDDNGAWYFDGLDERITTSIPGSTGSSEFTITFPANTGSTEIEYGIFAIAEYSASAFVRQLSNSSDITFAYSNDLEDQGVVPYDNTLITYTVRSTYPWTATTSEDYAVIESGATGSGNTDDGETVVVRVQRNREEDERYFDVSFTNYLGTRILDSLIQEADYTFTVTPSTLTFTNTGGTMYFSISSGGRRWRITDISSWASYNQMQGIGDAIIGITAEENTGTEKRYGSVYVYDAENKVEHIVSLVQNGAAIRTLIVTPSSATASDLGSYIQATLSYPERGDDFIITSAPNYIEIDDIDFNEDNIATFTIYVGENPTTEQRTATIQFNGAYASTTMTIVQEAGLPFIYVAPEELEFDSSGGTKTITITSNENWTI